MKPKAIYLACAVALIVTFTIKLWPPADGCVQLDREFGRDAYSPKKMLETLNWSYREPTDNITIIGGSAVIQRQALVRLLALQEREFGVVVGPKHKDTLQLDHYGAGVIQRVGGGYVVEGCANLEPDEIMTHADGADVYYKWERFHFDAEGRLLKRSAIRY